MIPRRCLQSLVKANKANKLNSTVPRRSLKQVAQVDCNPKIIPSAKEKENRWKEGNSSFSGQGFGLGFAGLTSAILGLYYFKNETMEAKQEKSEEPRVSRREQRFNEFASYEYLEQIVMSPQDFIESITENKPKLARRGKIRLTERDFQRIETSTPLINKGSNTFFRDRHHDGVITYPEYIFLVTILTKSNSGLQTALKMMDVNGDRVISSEEFQLIVKMISKSASKSARTRDVDEITEENENENNQELLTTLMIHLFGKYGTGSVTFDQFFKFMDDFQSEVLELEFHEYSKSMKTISEMDFAKILLRSTKLSKIEHSDYLDRMKGRLELTDHPKGITLDQFKAFHTFLSNLEDFVIAVNMTNVMNQSVDKELFTRAIKVTTGNDIDPYVTDVVFSLFDQDGDGELSQEEFIGIMKDRLKRGFGKFPNTYGFAGFKHCLKKEMAK